MPARDLENDVELPVEVDAQRGGVAPADAARADGREAVPVADEGAAEVPHREPAQGPREPGGAGVRQLYLRGAGRTEAEQEHAQRAAEKDPA
jgi:hypothetical protein